MNWKELLEVAFYIALFAVLTALFISFLSLLV